MMKTLKESIRGIIELDQKIIQTDKEVKIAVDELIANKPKGTGPLAIDEADTYWGYVNKAATLNKKLTDQKEAFLDKLNELKTPLKLIGRDIKYHVLSDIKNGIDGGNWIFSYNEQEDIATMRKE